MLIVPAIDILGGKVVRLPKGDFNNPTVYELSALAYAQKWQAQGATFIHVVDLDGARSGEPKNFDIIKEIVKHSALKIEVGGGIRDTDIIRRYLELGVERVVLSTRIIEDASFLLRREIKDYLPRVAVSIDIKQMASSDVITTGTAGWLQSGDVLIDIPSFMQAVVSAGVSFVNFSDISKDGMMSGLDTQRILSFLKSVRAAAGKKLYFTYAGGVSTLEDIKALKATKAEGLDAAIVGRALYEDKFTLKEAFEAAR